MKLIILWPYEIKQSNRAHYARINALLNNFSVVLITTSLGQIEMGFRSRFERIVCTSWKGQWCWLQYPWIVIRTAFRAHVSKQEPLIYVFYNLTILPAMVASIFLRVKIFVDFLDDPCLSTQILELEKRKKWKLWAYWMVNWLFLHFVTKTSRIIGYSAIGLSKESILPRTYSERYSIVPSKLICVPNGVDLSITHSGNSKQDREEVLRIIYVGIVGPRRGTDSLISSLSKIKELRFELIIIGEAAAKKDEQWISQITKKHPWISYKGPLPHNEVLEWIDKSDAGVFIAAPNVVNYRYTHPIKVLEYLAMGKPVIAPRFEGTMEIIKNGYNGVLFNPNQPGELIDIIVKNADSFRKGKFSNNALKSVERFDWKIIHHKFIADFQKILDSRL